MKSLKKLLSAILAVAMAATCISTVMVSADTAAQTDVLQNLYDENFDDGVIKWNNSGKDQFELLTDGDNKYIKIKSTSNGSSNTFGIGLPEIAEGKFRIKFDYMTNDTTNKSWVTLENGPTTRNANEYFAVLGALGGQYCVFSDKNSNKSLTTIEPGVWYTQEVVFDMDTQEVIASICKKGSTTPSGGFRQVLGRSKYEYFDWPLEITSFNQLRFRNGADCYVDNIVIDELKVNNSDILFNEDYEGVASNVTKGTGTIITDNSGNNYMKMTAGWSTSQFAHNIPTLSDGRILIEFDLMRETISKQSYIILANEGDWYKGKEWFRLLGIQANNNLTAFDGNTVLGAVEAGQWYTHKVEIDMKSHEISTAIYKKGSTKALGTKTAIVEPTDESYMNWPATATSFTQLRQVGDADTYIDNIMIKRMPAKDPDVIFSEDYDGVAYKAHRGTGTLVTEENGNKYMSIDMTSSGLTDWGVTAFAYTIPEMTTGKYQIKFDYMTTGVNDQAYIDLANNSYYTPKEWLRLLGATKNGKFTALSGANDFGTFIPGQWYTQYVTVDMDTHEVGATLYKKGETTPIASVIKTLSPNESSHTDWPATSNSFVRLVHYGGDDGNIDSIEIKKLPKDETVIFEENYEDPIFTPIQNGTGTLVKDETGNTSMKMDLGWSQDLFAYTIPEISSGIINIEFDYMKESLNSQTYLALASSNNNYQVKEWLQILRVSPTYGVITPFAYRDEFVLGRMTAKTWYTEKLMINMDTHEVSATLYLRGSDTPIETVSATLERTASGYTDWPETTNKFVRLVHFGGDAVLDNCYIDNIKISRTYNVPSLDSDSVVIKTADGEEQLIWTEVAASAKVIDIDFGTTMNQNTMTDEFIYVTKKNSEDKIPATIAYANGIATITAADNWAEGTYTIHVSGDVTNASGVKLGDDFAIDFTVVAGTITAMIDGVYSGDEFIEEFVQVSPGMELLIPVTFTNNSGLATTVKFITAYYKNDGSLTGITETDVPVTSETESSKDVKVIVEAKKDATKMTFFIWNGFTSMSPLASSYPLY